MQMTTPTPETFVAKRSFAPPEWALIAVNVIPALGVFFWHWDVYMILLLYWLENLVIGFFNLCKMAVARGEHRATWLNRLFLMAFFCVHFGGFCAGHGFFLLSFFGQDIAISGAGDDWGPLFFLAMLWQVITVAWQQAPGMLGWPVLALVGSHGFSFYAQFIRQGEFRAVTLRSLFVQPYKRIALLHIVIILGALAVEALGSPAVLVVLLVAGKVAMDVKLHRHEHRKANAAAADVNAKA